MVLVTKRTERPRPHVILLIAAQAGGKPMAVTSGYRLYGSDAEVDALKTDPRQALDELIRRFGREFSINGSPPTKFIETRHVDAPDITIDGGGNEVTVSSWVRKLPGGGWDASYVWAIDEARYRAALSSN
jgi:hypothetical protein